MKYGNEFKVGITIIISTVIFILGVRYFEDLPLFRGTMDLVTEFENAEGLISGNVVRVRGLAVGSVKGVHINHDTGNIRVEFQVDRNVPVTEGSQTRVTGIDALGVVRMELDLGPANAPLLEEGSFVPSAKGDDLLAQLSARAPQLLGRADTVLLNLDATLSASRHLLDDSGSDLRTTLTAARGTMTTLDRVLRAEQARLARVLENTEALTGSLNTFVGEQGDSLGAVVSGLNATLRRLDRNLANLENTTASLDVLIAKVNNGEGTLGLLLTDSTLYFKLDSTLANVNSLIDDVRAHPGKYLRELRLVDIF